MIEITHENPFNELPEALVIDMLGQCDEIGLKLSNSFQNLLPSGFADIVIILEDEIVVMELKVEPLQFTHYLQLKGYIEDLNNFYKNIKKFSGVLIGKQPKDDFTRISKEEHFDFKLLILNEDICTRIKICDNCRLANDIINKTCFNCSNTLFFKETTR